jgi:osmoprotectant transport system ATP-binding protein
MPTIEFENVSKQFDVRRKSPDGQSNEPADNGRGGSASDLRPDSKGNSPAPGVYDISLTMPPASFITILGASGSGKTTLLKLINRLHPPSRGIIRIDGKDIATIPETRLRRGMGYVIQQVGLFQHLSVAENVAIVPKILKWPKARIERRIDELLHMVGLEPSEYRSRYPRQLSGGQQQRVGLARALAGDPAILLMDEPFGAIDPLIRQRLQDEMLDLQSQLKKNVVFVTHDVREALKLGDRVILMRQGRVQQYDTPDHLLRHPANDFVARLLDVDSQPGNNPAGVTP